MKEISRFAMKCLAGRQPSILAGEIVPRHAGAEQAYQISARLRLAEARHGN
jgi:hypothetical protein